MQVLVTAVEKLIAGEIPADTQLDILEAAQARSTGRIAELLAKYDASRSADDPLANYREAMFGGDAGRGAQIFYVRTDLSCARCHRIDDSGGEWGLIFLVLHWTKNAITCSKPSLLPIERSPRASSR